MFCKASTELAKENTVLVSEIFIVYFFLCQMTVTQKRTMEFDKKFLVLISSVEHIKVLVLPCHGSWSVINHLEPIKLGYKISEFQSLTFKGAVF